MVQLVRETLKRIYFIKKFKKSDFCWSNCLVHFFINQIVLTQNSIGFSLFDELTAKGQF